MCRYLLKRGGDWCHNVRIDRPTVKSTVVISAPQIQTSHRGGKKKDHHVICLHVTLVHVTRCFADTRLYNDRGAKRPKKLATRKQQHEKRRREKKATRFATQTRNSRKANALATWNRRNWTVQSHQAQLGGDSGGWISFGLYFTSLPPLPIVIHLLLLPVRPFSLVCSF